jgi:hypothetical protein
MRRANNKNVARTQTRTKGEKGRRPPEVGIKRSTAGNGANIEVNALKSPSEWTFILLEGNMRTLVGAMSAIRTS